MLGRIALALCCFADLSMGCKDEGLPPVYLGPKPGSRDAEASGGRNGGTGGAGGFDGGPLPDGGADAAVESGVVPAGCESSPELRVLFIGNSHTYSNDLPALTREFACAAGKKISVQSVTPGGANLLDHAVNPMVLAAIDAESWDFVFLQDQQQFPGFRLEELDAGAVPAAVTLVDAIRANHQQTRPIFFMVWARREGDPDNCAYYPLACTFEGNTRAISQGYRLYAERTNAEVAPVALAWADVRADTDPPLLASELWQGDGSHPALPGSYLAAAVLTSVMFDTKTAGLPYTAGLEGSVATYLRTLADRIVEVDKADPSVLTAEQVAISCEYSGACSDMVDATAVTFKLSSDSCAELSAGTASVVGRLQTTMGCRDRCATVPLGGWQQVPSTGIESGTYQVHAHADVNANGSLDSGDLEACDILTVGGGADLTFANLTAL